MRSIVLGVLFSVSVSGAAAAQDPVAKGEQVFTAQKCSLCHSIAGKGNAKGSLDGVGGKLKADEIKAWMRTPKEMAEKAKADRKPPMPAYSKEKLSDADVDALTAYLLSLKK